MIEHKDSLYPEYINDNLQDAAWDVLHDNPGCDMQKWMTTIIKEYPAEIVEKFGSDPRDVYHRLSEWWNGMAYADEVTGICQTYREWAQFFKNENAKAYYDQVVAESLDKGPSA